MTTLYRPVLIESAEQAEALPAGTIVIHPRHRPLVTLQHEGETSFGYPGQDITSIGPDHVIGHTALVPFEAEVEQIRESGGRRRRKTLYVTPWRQPAGPEEEAPALADCGDQE